MIGPKNGLRLCGGVAVAALLAGCASSVTYLPSLTSFDRTDCATAPDLAGAIDLTPQKDDRAWTVDQSIGETGPCLVQDGASVPYTLFALPPAGSSRAVEIGSLMEPGRLFSPRIALLDADGRVVRQFETDNLMFRSSIYSTRFVPSEDQRYVLVTAEPSLIGSAYDTINSAIVSDFGMGMLTGTSWLKGQENRARYRFSYAGMARGIVYRLED